MKNNIAPFSIHHYLAIVLLLLIISVAATILVGPKLADYGLPYYLLSTFGSNILESSSITITRILTNSQITLFDVGLTSFLFACFLLVALAFKITLKARKNKQADYAHAHGPKLLEFNAALKNASQKLRKEPGKTGIKIHPKLRFTDQLEQGNILIVGQQGGGKSTIIKPLAKQIYQTNSLSFTYDEKGEYQSTFKNTNAICLKLNADSEFIWNISDDVKDSNDASLAAQAMLEGGNGNDRFFIDAARQILKGVIIHLQNSHQNWSWKELHLTLFTDVKQLKRLLQKAYPSAAGLVEPDNKTTHSIISVLSSRLFWIRDMAALQKSVKNTWCITEMMKHVDGKCHVFFRPNYSNPDLSRAVCNTLVTLIIERLLAHEDSNSRKCYLILDELGNLPHNPSLIRYLTLSRSKGGRTIASAQSISLLYENYGQNNTETILSLFRTIIVMRLGASGPTAQKASDLLGQQRVLTVNQNLSDGDKLAISTQFADRPVVLKEDIINLPSADQKGVVGFLFIGGLVNIYKLKWPYIKSERVSNRQPISYSGDSKLTTPVYEVTANRLNKRSLLTDSNSKSN